MSASARPDSAASPWRGRPFAVAASLQTRTTKTENAYRRRFATLAARARAELATPENEEEIHPAALVAWLISRKNELRPASWRLYRAATLFVLRQRADAGQLDDEGRAALVRLEAETQAGCKSKGERTWFKRRCLPDDDLQKLRDHLKSRRTRNAMVAWAWLYAIRLTGLRPAEWITAELFEDELGHALYVRNAKNTNGRAHGPSRVLSLATVTERDIDIIARVLNVVQKHHEAGLYERLYDNVATLLRQANKALWPRRKGRYTLYSGRHAFAANAKRKLSREEVAALMGHSSRRHASVYGHSRNGMNVNLPMASERDLRRIMALPQPDIGGVTEAIALDYDKDPIENDE